jgi:signal transduction histidine kinase
MLSIIRREKIAFCFSSTQELAVVSNNSETTHKGFMHLAALTKELPLSHPVLTPRSRFEDAEYLDIMCHEIGTPLAAIIGLADILANVDCSAQKKSECAEMLRDSSNMLMGLMKNMLDYSKLEAGKIEIENIDFDLAKVVQEAVHIMAIRAEQKGLELDVHIDSRISLQFMGDPLRIRQILVNLLSNAVKFTENGYIALYVNAKTDAHGQDQLFITVEDTGIGMDAASLKKVFGRYVQANSSISRKYGGTGLGLSISQDLAYLMHGEITVKSWPGMGSHFTVTLPLEKTIELAIAA